MIEKMRVSALGRAIVAASVTWAVLLVLATYLAGRNAFGGGGYLISAMTYGIGSLICHQRPERSFSVWSAQFPVCARCAGIYGGAALAAVTTMARQVRPRPALTAAQARGVLAMASLPTAATLLYEWTTNVTPGHWTRAIAGLILGAGIAWILVRSTGPQAVEIH